MNRIVVGMDSSPASRNALRWASDVALRTGAEIIAVHAFRNPYSEVSVEDHDRLVAERESDLAGDWTRPAREAGVGLRTVVRDGDPRDVLWDLVEAESADLIVMGRTGPGGGPGFLHLGSVVEHAAHHTRVPLAVIPAGATEPAGRILLGVDGSPDSLEAVAWIARTMASSDGSAVSVVAVAVEEPVVEWTPATSPDNWRRDAERDVAEWTSPLEAAGVEVTVVVQRDLHPADALLGVASARRCDLVVLGTRGLGGVTGLRAGGVALKVLHATSLPLVLVPAT